MYYTIYKITNQIDGKIYIGSHKTKDLNDGYMGSGKYLKRAQNKYGILNFKKEILFVFDTPDEMYKKEVEIVNEDFLANTNTYNLKIGGFGGFDYINSKGKNVYGKNGKPGYGGENLKPRIWTESDKIKHSAIMRNAYLSGNIKPSFSGKSHTAETKYKIGKANSILQSGEKNSQFGKRWIFNNELKISKKISKNEILPDGWNEGRKIKF
jgi:hypothetical protein